MIIKRDILVHSPSIAAAMMQAQAAAAAASKSPTATLPSSSPQTVLSPQNASPGSTASHGSPASGKSVTPLQQRDLMQREQREKERRLLLQKASNSQGQVVEKLMATYLAV